MKKSSISTQGSHNHLSYMDNYNEFDKYKQLKSENSVNNPNAHKEYYLSRKVRWFMFIVFIFLTLLMNMDHGTIPAATDDIRKDLKIGDDTLGLFGSLVFFGNLIGKNKLKFN